jgi:subtilase family protein
MFLPQDIINAALNAGLVLVASAGNDAMSFIGMRYPLYPASLRGVIAVGGVQRDGRWWNRSNYGYLIDLVAPASEIVTITFDPAAMAQTQAIVTDSLSAPPVSGTSFSAPFVSGGAAVVMGRFSNLYGHFMDDWLRAKAFDITDPLGDGTTHIGEDSWTGAGLLNIENASVSALNLADSPIDVDLVINRPDWHIKAIDGPVPWEPFVAVGSPPIGVRVQGASISEWTLAYAAGEFPDPASWTQIYRASGPSDFVLDSSGQVSAGALTPLNTDSLVNGQLYKLRLQAINAAGTVFTTFALFTPAKARVAFPEKNRVIVPTRGWFPLAGYARIRPGQSYSVSVRNASGANLWTSVPYTNPYFDYPVTAGLFLFMNNGPSEIIQPHQYCGYCPFAYTARVPMFPDPRLVLSEGFIEYVLNVGTDSDALRLYVDNSNFPVDYWPIRNLPIYLDTPWSIPGPDNLDIDDLSVYSTCVHNHYGGNGKLVLNLVNDGSAARMIVEHQFGVSALDQNGVVVWQVGGLSYSGSSFLANVDQDPANELCLGGLVLDIRNGHMKYTIPERPFVGEGGLFLKAAGNVTGDSEKEIIAGNVFSNEGSVGSRITALRVDGTILWSQTSMATDLYQAADQIRTIRLADVDNDGLEEILIAGTGQILRGNGTFLPGWGAGSNYRMAEFARAGSTTRVVLGDGNNVYVKSLNGATSAGWPVEASQFKVGKISAGGDDQIVLYSDRLRIYNLSGSVLGGSVDIVPDGPIGGFQLIDVDRDGVSELLVAIDRVSDVQNPPDTQVVGNFLEAYRLPSGDKLSTTDNRWPISLEFTSSLSAGCTQYHGPNWDRDFAIGDINGDGIVEVVQLLRVAPFYRDYRPNRAGIQLEVMHLTN